MRLWIKEIHLENFQGHENTQLKLHEGVNIIQGETHQGKSSIVRAIQFIYENNPRNPNEIIMDGKDYCKVVLVLSNDYSITKIRKERLNQYIITYPDGNEEILKGFGTEVPNEILNILQAPLFKVDNTTDGKFMLNIANQLEPHFLLTSTGSIRAKVLTKITGGNIFDEAIKINNHSIQKNNQKQTILSEEIQEIKVQIDSLSELDNSFDKVNKLLTLITEYRKIQKQFEELEKLINKLQSVQEKMMDLEEVSKLINKDYNVVNMYQLSSKHLVNNQSFLQLNRLFANYEKSKNLVNYYQLIINKTNNLENITVKIEDYRNTFKRQKQLIRVQNQHNTNSEKLKKGKVIEEVLSDIGNLYENSNNAINKKRETTQLNQLFENFTTVSNRINNANQYISKLNKANEVKLKIEEYQQYNSKMKIVLKHRERYLIDEKNIKSKEELLTTMEFLPTVIKQIDKVKLLNNSYIKLIDYQKQYTDYNKNISDNNQQITLINNKLEKWNERLSTYDVCPLCSQSLPHNHLKKEEVDTNE